MNTKTILATIAAITMVFSGAQADNLGGKAGGDGGRSGNSGGGSSGSGNPSSSGNSNFDNGSVYSYYYVKPPCVAGTPRCKTPLPPVTVQVPVTGKCQVERWVQTGKAADGAPLYRLIRDCDRVVVR